MTPIAEYLASQQKNLLDFRALLLKEKIPVDQQTEFMTLRAINDIHGALLLIAERLEGLRIVR